MAAQGIKVSSHLADGNMKQPFKLYHNIFSICSLQVRFCISLGNLIGSSFPNLEFEEHEIDIYHSGQLDEQFLCHVNPKGQVPTLVNESVLATPLTDSMDITFYLAELYPSLCPTAHTATIVKMVKSLHSISFLALSFTRPHHREYIYNLEEPLKAILAKQDLSAEYRRALEWKLQFHNSTQSPQVTQESTDKAIAESKTFLEEVDMILSKWGTGGNWLFGATPTSLDAHVIVFIARLRETGNENIIPGSVSRYADTVMAMPEWQKLMNGKPTSYSVYNTSF